MSRAVRNVSGIIAWAFSGFFLYALNLLAFINQPAWPVKVIIIAMFAVPAIVFLIIAAFCRGFDKVRRDLGIVLLSAAGMSGLLILFFVCMMASPDIAKFFPPDGIQMFSAVLSGFACLALYLLVGLGLVLTRRKNGQESNPARP